MELVRAHFQLTPRGIIESLDLRRPIYRKTAAFGHFGRTEPEFTWERTDKAAALRTAAGIVASYTAEVRSQKLRDARQAAKKGSTCDELCFD